MSDASEALSLDKALDVFKFYEEAAEKTKGHAWSQTTWILTLNAGILAFSLNLFAAYSTKISLRRISRDPVDLLYCGPDFLWLVVFCDPRAWSAYCQLLGNSEQARGQVCAVVRVDWRGNCGKGPYSDSDLQREVSKVLYKTDVAGRLVHGGSRRVGDCRHGPDVQRIWPRRFRLRA